MYDYLAPYMYVKMETVGRCNCLSNPQMYMYTKIACGSESAIL